VDGIPIGRPQIMGLSFFDLERVEVLRGPQGTLYGKSSTGGAINVITAKPQFEFDTSASLDLGNFNARRAEGMINVPLSDSFAVRAAVSFNNRDGYIDPVLGNSQNLGSQAKLGDEDNQTARVSALWKFGDTGDLQVTGTFGKVSGSGGTATALYDSVLAHKGSAAREVYFNPMATGVDDRFHNINAELNLNLGAVLLTYDGAAMSFKGHDNFDPSANNPVGNGDAYTWQDYISDIQTDSHELRVSNAEPQRFGWVLGANYWKESIDEVDMNWLTLSACAPSLDAACNSPNPHIVGLTKHQSKGFFGQINFKVTDAFKLTLGARSSSDEMSRDATIAAGPPPPGGWVDANGAPCGPPNYCVGSQPDSGSQSANKLTWRVGADYQFTTDQMVYASVATGYKAGSFNDLDPATGAAGSYGPEDLIAYEVGYKGRILPNLQFNSSIYFYDYDKYQLTGATFLAPNITNGPPLVLIYTTLVPATLKGWENELKWSITENDRLDLTLTLAKGEFSGGPNHAKVGFSYNNQIDWSGKTLDNLPELAATLAYEHHFNLSDGSYFSARLASKYSDGYFVSNLQGDGNPFIPPQPDPSVVYGVLPQQFEQQSFTRTDVSFGYTSESGKFGVTAYVRNLEDDLQFLGAPQLPNPTTGGTVDRTYVRVSDPRTFGVRFNWKY
jgi:iron complex outermembrane recepter protein